MNDTTISRDYHIFIGQMHNPRSLKASLFEE